MCTGHKVEENNFEKKNKVKGSTLPHIKAYYIVMVIKAVWYGWKDRYKGK